MSAPPPPRSTVVGFVGLGAMGAGMATNMLGKIAAGGRLEPYQALFFDVRPGVAAAMAELAPNKASVAEDAAHVARESDLLLLSLPNDKVVQSFIADNLEHLRKGAVVIDTSTTNPQAAKDVASKLESHGNPFLDAPVTGAPARATAGTLTIMVGGEESVLEQARPILETFTDRIVHVGAVGNGQLSKSMNNCLYNIGCAAMAEMLPLAERAGVPLDSFCEVVSNGTGQSYAFNQWAPHVLRREFEAPKYGYPMGVAFKDVQTVASLAEEQKLPQPPVFSAMKSTYEKALSMGLQDEHKGAMVKVFEEQFGVECKTKP
mmetsp:Transcript_65520/g.142200  ORF Transcript_65520/g.142200 Transcript_65520/m.142200 type:complete len:318 (-) Transcript_65520:200-1153(-)|eukprot:CAMPEP_0206502164 /NCGR_PEP_ID=MMETSP0324_2-20121206/53827_1 /ASSEMBLY_ACC=CAM_ASM_000836 /TAXON_ID=2866 /ORGANISM="Crypthecodinium cohnii, Strain Seligo" /LENGTH=317 /DNA_ID=CAMNT_0053990291 /DNA_START=158 /DNA_END=1111 /DNA_ORIENTATION=+